MNLTLYELKSEEPPGKRRKVVADYMAKCFARMNEIGSVHRVVHANEIRGNIPETIDRADWYVKLFIFV